MSIQEFLAANPRFKAEEVMIPEDCALCALEGDDQDLYHIYMDEGFARIELFEIEPYEEDAPAHAWSSFER